MDGSYLPTAIEGYKAGKTYEGWVMTVARADLPVVLGFIPDVFHDPPQEHPDGSLAWPPPASWVINQPQGQAVPTWAPSLGLCSMD